MLVDRCLGKKVVNTQDLTWVVSLVGASRLLSVGRLGLFPIVIACQRHMGAKVVRREMGFGAEHEQ